MNLSVALAETIRARRKTLGLSQQELADKASLHRTFISRFERGLTEMSVPSLNSVAIALRTTPSRLLAEAETLQRQASKIDG